MGYFWLNQRSDPGGYADIEGEVYHYRNNVPGYKLLSPGDAVVFYRPGKYVVFGTGTIAAIEPEPSEVESSGALVDYRARIEGYRAFEPPVEVREIKDRISFLQSREGLRGVPQNSIYEINREDFAAILREAGFGDRIREV